MSTKSDMCPCDDRDECAHCIDHLNGLHDTETVADHCPLCEYCKGSGQIEVTS